MVQYVLDTNICIYIAKHSPPKVLEKFSGLQACSVGMSLITHGELLYGAYRSQNREKAQNILDELVTMIPVLPLNEAVAQHYAEIRANLTSKGMLIGNNDLWIAAHVRSLQKTLVTNNVKEFTRVQGLAIENWCC
jgi:tRNA(fMet)-specific endonuclease VapC